MTDTNSHGGGAVDRAIDRAVRRMMEAAPPPGLRRRVLARLEEPAPTMVPRLAVAVAALAILVLAVVMLRPSPQPASEIARTEPAAAPAEQTQPATPSAAPAVATPEPARVAAAPRRPAVTSEEIRMPRITNVFGSRTARATAAAAAVDDVVFPADESRPAPSDLLPGILPITVPHITVAPLEIERLRIDPPTRK